MTALFSAACASRDHREQQLPAVPDGRVCSYHPNGQLAADGHLRGGMRDGLWVYYDPYGAWDRVRSGYYEADHKVAPPPWSDGAVVCTSNPSPEELERDLQEFLARVQAEEEAPQP